jgi:hypothetical protein
MGTFFDPKGSKNATPTRIESLPSEETAEPDREKTPRIAIGKSEPGRVGPEERPVTRPGSERCTRYCR